jgi:perosamine synthetase
MTEASSELKKLFDAIASLVQSSTAEDYISDEIKLRLYGLYKRCTGGRAADSDALEPAMWNIAAYRKCNAWKKCDDLELDEAMEEYVRVVAMLENSTGSKCRSLYNDSQSGKDFGDSEGTVMQKPVQTKETNIENAVIKSTSEQPRPMLSVAPAKPSIFQKFTGIKPFIPRGELDITFSDLSFALLRCIRPPSPFFEAPMRAALRLEDEIAQTWNEYASTKSHVLPGLSVRSLVDLHLSAKSYPKGSEVIIVPPIGIEGMMDVIQYHGLKIVPVDIGDYTNDPVVHVDVEKVKQKMNKKTVAVLVVHPFGLICMNESEMKALRNAVDDHSTTKSIEIWEDCAECFGGKHGYMGSEYANVHFFSFGMIKTATALGGGICVLNDQVDNNANATMERMKRIQHMMNGQQTGKDFFVKIQKTFLLLIISRNSILMGILVWILDLLKIDYDSIITSAVKGFPSPHSKAGVKLSTCELNEQKRTRARKLVQRLRRSPHPALLSLLHRRLKSKITSVTVMKRIERCAKMKGLFKEDMPSIHIPEGSAGSQHLYWLFPIITIDPDKTCREMKDFGYDIPRGTSQLGCVTKYLIDSEKYSNSCPNTLRMMSQISYLPIASRDMSEVEMRRLVQTFRICAAGQYQFETELRKVDAPSSYSIAVLGFIAAAITILDAYTFQTLLWANFLSKYLLKILLSFSGGLVAIFVILLILRVAVGRDYINCSNSFSRYNSIMFQRPDKPVIDNETPVLSESGASIIDGAQLHAQTYDLDKQDTLALSVCKNDGVDDGKQVLLTGATGFIGSLLLRELLLHREQLSIKGGVVLICRSKSDHSAKQRVQALLSKDMFSFLTKDQRENLVTVIEGDLSCPRLGISLEDYNGICNELNITHVINSAACVNFTEPLARAAESNITSSLQMQGLTKSIKRNRAKYIYLSTAFVHGNKTGSAESPLPQDLFDFGKYDPLELYESMMNTESCASAAMTDLDFPNTYTFSKSICEHLLMRDKRVRTIIIRPCIVGPAVQKPYEGWAGETPSTLIAGACLFLSTYNLWSFRRERAAVIPVDVVCRFIIAKAFDSPTEDRNIATDDHSSGISSDDSSTHESEHSSEQSYIFTKDPTSDKQTALRPNNCIQDSGNLIYNAAWDFSSPESASFQWYSFACAVLQLGAANNHFGKSTTYLLFILSFKILLAMDLTLKNFRKVHRLLVHWPLALIKDVCECCNLRPRFLRDLEKVMPFLDLPLLFFPFTSATFHFESDLVAPMSFNAERYMFSSVLAAEKFVISLSQRKHRKALVIQPVIKGNRIIMAGKKCPRPISDLLWCMMQPRGNIAIRFIGWIVIKLLRVIASEVTIDIDSFTSIARAVKESQDAAMYKNDSNNKTFVILAPTHRSFLDFIILSFITFHLPELGIPIPSIAAANDFSRIPFLGPLARMAGAFFVKRGKGIADPALQAQVHLLKDRYSDNEPTCIEVFLEGCRSRDRRFVKPKTGFLR